MPIDLAIAFRPYQADDVVPLYEAASEFWLRVRSSAAGCGIAVMAARL